MKKVIIIGVILIAIAIIIYFATKKKPAAPTVTVVATNKEVIPGNTTSTPAPTSVNTALGTITPEQAQAQATMASAILATQGKG